jgi:hypothetical protein
MQLVGLIYFNVWWCTDLQTLKFKILLVTFKESNQWRKQVDKPLDNSGTAQLTITKPKRLSEVKLHVLGRFVHLTD